MLSPPSEGEGGKGRNFYEIIRRGPKGGKGEREIEEGLETLFGLVVVAVTPTARGEWKVGKFSKEKEEKVCRRSFEFGWIKN